MPYQAQNPDFNTFAISIENKMEIPTPHFQTIEIEQQEPRHQHSLFQYNILCNLHTRHKEQQSIDSQEVGKMSNTSGEKMDITTLPSHACEIDITFPTDLQAEQALQILQVDKEPTDRVSKTFRLVREDATIDSESGGTDSICKLRVWVRMMNLFQIPRRWSKDPWIESITSQLSLFLLLCFIWLSLSIFSPLSRCRSYPCQYI